MKNMNLYESTRIMKKCNLVILLLLLFSAASSAQTMPTDIVIQGVLRDQQNRLSADGEYSMTFSLYTQESGGTPVWTSVPQGVMVQNGVFSARLNEFNANVTFRSKYYVGITVIGMGTELVPRLELTAATNAMAIRGGQNIIAGAGYIGLGVLNPSERLEVDGNVKVSGSVYTNDSLSLGSKIRFQSSPAGIYSANDKPLLVQNSSEGAGDRFVLSAGGDAEVQNSLEVNTGRGAETGNNTPVILQNSEWGKGLEFFSNLGGALSGNEYYISRGGQDNAKNDLVIHIPENQGSRLSLMASGNKSLMSVDGSSGNVGIGKSPNQNAKLDVAGKIYASGTSPIHIKEFTMSGWYAEYNTLYSSDEWVGVIAGINSTDFDLYEHSLTVIQRYCFAKEGTIWIRVAQPATSGGITVKATIMFIRKELVNGSMPAN